MEEESPNWLAMPHELMENILQRLDDVEIFNSALKVCTTWWRICKGPTMWKVIKMHKPFGARSDDYHLEAFTKQAVRLSSGELIDISILGFGTDHLLDYIVRRSSKLKSLCVHNCDDMTGRGLSQAVKRAPQLEKLHVSFISINEEDIEVIGQSCPPLKSFKLMTNFIQPSVNDHTALAIANNMPELCHLDLSGSDITNNGLQAVLNGCSHLESLDVRSCESLNLDGILEKLCREQIKDFKCSHKYTRNCDFHPWIQENCDFYEDDINEDSELCGGSVISVEDEYDHYHYDYNFDPDEW